MRSDTLQKRARKALNICASCPVLHPCRTETLETGYAGYIAGGLLPWQQGPITSYTIVTRK